MDSSHLLVQMKHFVKSSESSSTNKDPSDHPKRPTKPSFISGSHVKQFYEKIVGKQTLETRHKPDSSQDTAKPQKKKTFKTPFNINLFMKAVEVGDNKYVEQILEEHEAVVNCQDQFGWTPLMSACCAGNIGMVRLLLQWQPDLSMRDKRGKTCRDLAAKNPSITDLLDSHITLRGQFLAGANTDEQYSSPSNFYCELCKQNVENATLKKHQYSTVHNFHAASKRKVPTCYGIPESNKGFQILVKSGWNKEDGLGPSGEGHKFPPKTILKQDRTGLGAKRYKPRVTHSVEDARREAKPKNTFKRQLRSEKRSNQRLEQNLRRMLS